MQKEIPESHLSLFKDYLTLWREADAVYARWFKQRQCSDADFRIFDRLLTAENGLEPAELADTLGFSRQTMTYMLDAQERAGRIERLSHPSDRRKKLIKLTTAGRVFAEEENCAISKMEITALNSIGAAKIAQLNNLSRQFIEALLAAFNEKAETQSN